MGCMAMGTMTTSCEDMLSPDSERHSYTVAQDTLYSYWGIIKSLQNVAERYVVLGECRGELISGTGYISDSITAILDYDMSKAVDGSCRYLKVSDYYHIINSCNAYLAYCDRERKTGTLQPYMLKEAAQVEAIRAWVYLQMVQVYGEVPFYTEPLLTTDDISAFMQSHRTVTIDNLADELAPSLTQALQIENEYGMPEYNTYNKVCHSSKVMIPLNVILGDLYLAKGDKASCTLAAQYYYDYLSNTQDLGRVIPGGTIPTNIHYGFKADGMEQPIYLHTGEIPWSSTGAVSSTQEAMTAIPSSTNKLWGTVLRGVNALYGYDSEIRVRTEDTSDTTSTTSASIVLTAKYDVKQLTASDAYFNLCKAQDFELYIAANASQTEGAKPTVDPEIGDARQYWVNDIFQTYPNGLRSTEKFITKLNPHGAFSTVGYMIYRKSMIWLRYAEALNGAGYPSYAFAILKNGLCNNDSWYPTVIDPAEITNDWYSTNYVTNYDYAIKERVWVLLNDSLEHWPTSKDYFDTSDEMEDSLVYYVDNGIMTEDEANALYKYYNIRSFENYPDTNSVAVLNYIDAREVKRAPSFLNFKFSSLDGENLDEIFWRPALNSNNLNFTARALTSSDVKISHGIHSHGCGALRYNERNSVYNYVDMVAKKAADYGYTLSKEDIYSGSYDDVVQKAVEDLIVDEEALELAFEGCRFFDLLRVAHRRNDPSYLAKRVALRNPALQGKLMNPRNWYFPLP